MPTGQWRGSECSLGGYSVARAAVCGAFPKLSHEHRTRVEEEEDHWDLKEQQRTS